MYKIPNEHLMKVISLKEHERIQLKLNKHSFYKKKQSWEMNKKKKKSKKKYPNIATQIFKTNISA